jgi:outer membrane PBP1 activator LpoA protein
VSTATAPATSVDAGAGPVALLVPQSGPLAQAGNAVRTAFIGNQPATVYDTGGTPQGSVDMYHRALGEGAGVIVGPLRKEDATAIVSSLPLGSPLPIPVVALNYLDPTLHPPAGLVQFGLAPEDEAQSAAADAYARGLRRAVMLLVDNDWGNRVSAAFKSRFETLGGHVIDGERFTVGISDFSAPIKALLKIDAAEARYHSLQSLLHVRLEFESRRRGDVDAVFIAARAAQARLITPQLRYYRAERLPIYGPSSVYDGTADKDLEGLRFCDVPAIVAGALPAGQAVDIARLDAMGRDAAQLAQAMRIGPLTTATTFNGASGQIGLDTDGVVRRQLGCAELSGGAVHPLSAPAASP